jgi:ribosome-associated protein
VSDQLPQILEICTEVLQSKKAEDLVMMDLRGISDFSDYFLICTANSGPHARALADAVQEEMKAAGHPAWHIEGYETQNWILYDFVDMVVHIFQSEARSFYGLERLWGDAPTRSFEEQSSLVESS